MTSEENPRKGLHFFLLTPRQNFVESSFPLWTKNAAYHLVMVDGNGVIDRDQKTAERQHSCPQIPERLSYRKHVELILLNLCQRNAVKVFSVDNPEVDGASHPL